jgi:hypothetical protein
MAFPIAALLGAAGTIGGGLIGAGAQQYAANATHQANMMNAWLRERERQDQRLAAQESKFDSFLGGTDAQGNKTMFIPGRGWVVMPSAAGGQIQSAQDNEQLMRLFRDLPVQRQMQEANYGRQLDDNATADNLMQEFAQSRVDPEDLRRMMMGDAARGINNEFDAATDSAMKSAIRRGTSNVPQILAEFAKQRANAMGEAFSGMGMQAQGMAEQITGNRRGNLANLIAQFSQRGRALPGTQFQPMNVGQTGNAAMGMFSGQANQMAGQGIQAAGRQGGTLQGQEPLYGMANTVAQGGQALGNVFGAWQQDQRQRELMNRLQPSGSF